MSAPNGWRYPLVGGTRQRHFDGTNLKPRNLPENAQTPTRRVHALLGSVGNNIPGLEVRVAYLCCVPTRLCL